MISRSFVRILAALAILATCYFVSPSSLAWLIQVLWKYGMAIVGGVGFLYFVFGLLSVSAGYPWKEERKGIVIGLLVALLLLFGQFALRPYFNLKHIWDESGTKIVESDTSNPNGYRVRPIPYEVAVNIITQRAGYFPGTEVRNVTYIHDVDEPAEDVGYGQWTAIANGGWFKETIGIISLHDDKTLETCQVSMPAMGGLFWNSLSNHIHRLEFLTTIDMKDAYGMCENGIGKLYVPIRKLHGPLARLEPAGVAEVLADGTITLYSGSGLAQLPGPTYPLSVVRLQEQSINTTVGFWKFVARQSGVQVIADEDDPNYGNPGQFLLFRVGNFARYGEYVSHLVPQGGIRSIVMRSAVNSKQLPSSSYNNIVFSAYAEQLTGNKAVADAVMLVVPPEERTSLSVWEVVPAFGATRVAYVGRPTQVEYLVWVDPEGVVINVERVNQPDFMTVDEGEVDWTNVSDEEFEKYFEDVLGEFLNRKNR